MGFLEDTVALFELGITSSLSAVEYEDAKALYFDNYTDWVDGLISTPGGSTLGIGGNWAALVNIPIGVLVAMASFNATDFEDLYDRFSNHSLIPVADVKEPPYPDYTPYRMVKKD
tara:strand:- start:913 stop:1257 length:345 start_codon:yes stop_codon:yes gene_type:complete